MGAFIHARGDRRRFLAILVSACIFLSGCAYKSGFNGEHLVETGGLKFVYCGDSASSAPRIKGSIVLFRSGFETSGVFENPFGLVDSIQSFGLSTGKCSVIESDKRLELKDGLSYLRFTRFSITGHQPFGNVVRVNGKSYATDSTLCLRMVASIRVDRLDGADTVSAVFNGHHPYFDAPVLAYFKELCKSD